jgi:phosphotriesterase-related protein
VAAKGKIQTVLGPIDPKELGWTITHEHLLANASAGLLSPAASAADASHWEEPLTLANHYEARREIFLFRDNTVLLSEDEAVEECRRFREHGGDCIVDVTPFWGYGRDPLALRRISINSGVHVVMGTGYYVHAYHPPEMASWDAGRVRDEILRDIELGYEKANVDTSTYGRFSGGSAGGEDAADGKKAETVVREHTIRPGVVGEIGLTWPVHPGECKSLQGSVQASVQSGLPLTIHPGRSEDAPLHAARLVEEFKGDLSRTIICHIDLRISDVQKMLNLARMGCYLELDAFGLEECYYPLGTFLLPNDAQRVRYLQTLMEHGFADQLLIAHDIDIKARTTKYGGEGRHHIVKRVVPLMRQMGLTWVEIDRILIDNPARILTIN